MVIRFFALDEIYNNWKETNWMLFADYTTWGWFGKNKKRWEYREENIKSNNKKIIVLNNGYFNLKIIISPLNYILDDTHKYYLCDKGEKYSRLYWPNITSLKYNEELFSLYNQSIIHADFGIYKYAYKNSQQCKEIFFLPDNLGHVFYINDVCKKFTECNTDEL